MLYRPLFWTSYWCEDWLYSSRYRTGASVVLISSASAKTAFCLAYLIGKRLNRGEISEKTRIIGLTSPRNVTFTKRLGLYHEVFGYDMFTSVPSFQAGPERRWIYIDVAGNIELNEKIFAHFASPYTPKLAACITLGLTNVSPLSADISKKWAKNTFTMSEAAQDMTSPSWPRVEYFFMPEWLEIRRLQIPIQEVFRRQNKAWKEVMKDCTGWVQLQQVKGSAAVKRAYVKSIKEGLGPEKGFIWSLWDEDLPKCEMQYSRL
jgi:hypothetical protein